MREIVCKCICAKVGLAFWAWMCHAPWTPTMQAELKEHGCPKKYDYVYIGAVEACSHPLVNWCTGWRAIYGEGPIPVDWVWERNGKLQRCEEVVP
jgi:hypothetical protein